MFRPPFIKKNRGLRKIGIGNFEIQPVTYNNHEKYFQEVQSHLTIHLKVTVINIEQRGIFFFTEINFLCENILREYQVKIADQLRGAETE